MSFSDSHAVHFARFDIISPNDKSTIFMFLLIHHFFKEILEKLIFRCRHIFTWINF